MGLISSNYFCKVNYDLKDFLDSKVRQYNQPEFIKDDPICIPHSFSKKQDIEIAGLFAAIFSRYRWTRDETGAYWNNDTEH